MLLSLCAMAFLHRKWTSHILETEQMELVRVEPPRSAIAGGMRLGLTCDYYITQPNILACAGHLVVCFLLRLLLCGTICLYLIDHTPVIAPQHTEHVPIASMGMPFDWHMRPATAWQRQGHQDELRMQQVQQLQHPRKAGHRRLALHLFLTGDGDKDVVPGAIKDCWCFAGVSVVAV